jgi:hypothetical protein
MPISWKIMSLDDLLNYVPPGPEDREDAYNRANEIAYRETLETYIADASNYRINGGSNPPTPPPPPPGI